MYDIKTQSQNATNKNLKYSVTNFILLHEHLMYRNAIAVSYKMGIFRHAFTVKLHSENIIITILSRNSNVKIIAKDFLSAYLHYFRLSRYYLPDWKFA